MSLPCLIASNGVRFRMEIKNPIHSCVDLEKINPCVRLQSMDNNKRDSSRNSMECFIFMTTPMQQMTAKRIPKVFFISPVPANIMRNQPDMIRIRFKDIYRLLLSTQIFFIYFSSVHSETLNLHPTGYSPSSSRAATIMPEIGWKR